MSDLRHYWHAMDDDVGQQLSLLVPITIATYDDLVGNFVQLPVLLLDVTACWEMLLDWQILKDSCLHNSYHRNRIHQTKQKRNKTTKKKIHLGYF